MNFRTQEFVKNVNVFTDSKRKKHNANKEEELKFMLYNIVQPVPRNDVPAYIET